MRYSVSPPPESTPVMSPAIAPPVADRRPTERELWGERVSDDLVWLRDGDNERVVEHLRAENAYTEAVLAPVERLQETIFQEIKSRIKEDDLSAPVPKDGWAYYSRTEEGLAYPIHCRRPLAPDASLDDIHGLSTDGSPDRSGEVVMLDENVEAGDSEFFDVGPFDVSPDHSLLLWGWDLTGDERYTATIRDLSTGEDRSERLVDVSYSIAWALDNETLFYVRPDEANRPYQVWRHRLGTEQAQDVLVFTEPDERFFVGVGLEKDHSFIQIAVSSKVTDEVWVIPASDPDSEPRVLAPRRQGVEYSVAHHHDRFVILTNDGGAENFKMMTVSDRESSEENWEELVIAESPDGGGGPVMISDFDVAADHLVLFERADGTTRIRIRQWSDGSISSIEQPEAVSTVWPGANPDFDTGTLRYGYGSMITPASLFSLDVTSEERTLLKREEVLGHFDPECYDTERLWAVASDGTRIPISIVYRNDRGNDPQPCVLYAYGAYEISTDPMFSAARLSLLDRGFSFAIAHVRGGGEMGRHWYLEGKYEQKENTFDDVVACARHLIDGRWTSSERLVLRGGSAGGLMVGAVINRAPELFTAAVAQVAFVDALNTMLDAALPLTVTEWEEWGNPAGSESIYRAMRRYSPYENVHPANYPSVFATGGLHDSRVGFWETAKWVQALRQHNQGDRPVLLWTDLGAGHGGPSGRYEAWREEARILSYILWALGLTT